MNCLRIYVSDVATGQSLHKIRIPLAIIRIVARFLPARAFTMIHNEIDGEISKELLAAIYQMLLVVANNEDGQIENGLIADVEEFNEEKQRYEQWLVFVE